MNIIQDFIDLNMSEDEMIEHNIVSVSMIAEKTKTPRVILKFKDGSETHDDDKIEKIIITIKQNSRIHKIKNII